MLRIHREKSTLVEAPFKEKDAVVFFDIKKPELFQEAKVLSNCIGAKMLVLKIDGVSGIETLSYDEAAKVLISHTKYRKYQALQHKGTSKSNEMKVSDLREMIVQKHNTHMGDEVCFCPSLRRHRREGFSMTHPVYDQNRLFIFGIISDHCRGEKIIVSTWSDLSSSVQIWRILAEQTFFVQQLPDVPDEARDVLKKLHQKLNK